MHWGKGKGGEVSNGTHIYPFGCGAPEGQESSMVGTPPPPLLPPGTGPLHMECAAPAFMEGQHFPPPTQSLIPLGPARPVFLAAATANIAPVSQNKQIAMQFVSSDRDTQTKMLGDPNVARAILQTLAASSDLTESLLMSVLLLHLNLSWLSPVRLSVRQSSVICWCLFSPGCCPPDLS